MWGSPAAIVAPVVHSEIPPHNFSQAKIKPLYLSLQTLCSLKCTADTCTAVGRYPNKNVPDCRGFTICMYIGNNLLTTLETMCPENFKFDPLNRLCSNNTNFRCSDEVPDFPCADIGTFQNPKIADCRSYIACVPKLNNITAASLYDCPLENVFDPELGSCVHETTYNCTVSLKSPNAPGGAVVHKINTLICFAISLFIFHNIRN